MPNRILKESICTSETINRLTADEEIFFYRLLVNCDDFGRMDGRAAILLAKCFPLRLGRITEPLIEKWLHSLEEAGLVKTYLVEGRRYVQVTTWDKHQQIRARRSKYPQTPESDIVCNHLISDDIKCPRNPIQSESNPNINTPPTPPEGEGEKDVPKRPRRQRGPIPYTEEFEEFWAFYPRSTGKQEAMRKWVATLARPEAPDRPKATSEMLVIAAKNYAAERDGEDEKYTKHAATFLGPDEHWREYLEPKRKPRNERPTRVYDDLQGKLEEMRRIREENRARQNPSP